MIKYTLVVQGVNHAGGLLATEVDGEFPDATLRAEGVLIALNLLQAHDQFVVAIIPDGYCLVKDEPDTVLDRVPA